MRFFYTFLLTLSSLSAFSQDRDSFQSQYTLRIARAAQAVQIDGVLDDAVWQNAEKASGFWLKWPRFGDQAVNQTEIRMTYDDQHLYVAVLCRNNGKNIVQSLKRDVDYWDSDGVALVIDPANRATNGYFFAATPAGVQTEGLISPNGDDGGGDYTWDNKWRVETSQHADHWTAEFAIPFQIIRYNEGQNHWGINFIRNDLHRGEWHTWTRVPFQFDGTDLGFTGRLIWDEAPKKAKGNRNFSPYITGSASRDFEAGQDWKLKPNVGLDAKIGIGSGLNMDLTFNPDFSQIEVDEQVINLTRFNVQLPEKRTFFLENADIFGNFGIPPIRPFFSRRIGLDANARQVPILYGARLSGNLDANTRIGAFNMQTRKSGDASAQNYAAVALRRRLFGRTTAGAYFFNRQGMERSEIQYSDYGRNAGGEFTYTSEDGRWVSWATSHFSFKPNVKKQNWWGDAGVQYNARKFDVLIDLLHMGENYEADMGFEARIRNYDALRDTTIRLGYNFIFSQGNYRIVPKEGSKLSLAELGFESFTVVNPDGSLNEQTTNVSMEMIFKNTMGLEPSVSNTIAYVPVAFKFDDRPNSECPPLPAGRYQFQTLSVEWGSDTRKPFSVRTEFSGGGFYNGRQYSASTEWRYRAQPWGNFRLKFEYNLLDFPAPYCDAELFAVTPRIEIFFNRNMNWTTFLQYNTQADNFNINSRLQWRYRPMSDLFLVYTDNYAAQIWGRKNRAFVLKLNYWL